MRIEELIELGERLAEDEATRRGGGGQRLLARDATLAPRVLDAAGLSGDRPSPLPKRARVRLARAWLAELGSRPNQRGVGYLVGRGIAWLGRAGLLVGLLFGAAGATGTLAYDGQAPINVLVVLALFALLPFVLTLLAVALLLRGQSRPRGFLAGVISRVLRSRFLARWLGDDEGQREALASGLDRGALPPMVERLAVFGIAQRLGLGFALGGLAVVLLTVAFSDRAFGWSTTLDVEASGLHRTLSVVAAPWQALGVQALPSVETVQATRWDRLAGGSFRNGTTPAEASRRAGEWWPLLVLAMLAYGVLPRVLVLLAAAGGMSRVSASRALSTVEGERLIERLVGSGAEWVRPTADSVGTVREMKAAPPVGASPGSPAAADAREGQASAGERGMPTTAPGRLALWDEPLWLAAWGRMGEELPRLEAAAKEASIPLLGAVAGGGAIAAETAAIAKLRAAAPQRLVALVEGGVQPTRELTTWLADLASVRGKGAPSLVLAVVDWSERGQGLLPVAPEQLRGWSTRLDELPELPVRLESWPRSTT